MCPLLIVLEEKSLYPLKILCLGGQISGGLTVNTDDEEAKGMYDGDTVKTRRGEYIPCLDMISLCIDRSLDDIPCRP